MSDIKWNKPNAETQYELDDMYLIDCGEDELMLAVFCVDKEQDNKYWYIEQEIYEFDDIKIEYYAKCRNGKLK